MGRTITENETLTYKGKKFKFPQILISALSVAKRRVDLKLDNFWLVSGAVGSGKSTIAQGIAGVYQMMYGRELNLNNFTWKSDGVVDFTDDKGNETQVIIQDEGIQGMTGRDGLTKAGQKLKVCLVTKRRMKIFYLILIDEIQEYSQKVINRAQLLIDTRFIMKNGDPTRGYFKIYSNKEIKEIYRLLKDKKLKSIREYKGNTKPFYTFSNYEDLFVNEEEYENKKIFETTQQDEEKNISWKKNKMLAFHMWSKGGYKWQEIADAAGVHTESAKRWLGDFKKATTL